MFSETPLLWDGIPTRQYVMAIMLAENFQGFSFLAVSICYYERKLRPPTFFPTCGN